MVGGFRVPAPDWPKKGAVLAHSLPGALVFGAPIAAVNQGLLSVSKCATFNCYEKDRTPVDAVFNTSSIGAVADAVLAVTADLAPGRYFLSAPEGAVLLVGWVWGCLASQLPHVWARSPTSDERHVSTQRMLS